MINFILHAVNISCCKKSLMFRGTCLARRTVSDSLTVWGLLSRAMMLPIMA